MQFPRAPQTGALFFLALSCCGLLAGQTLRQLADQRGVKIGAAVDPSRFSETLYATTLSREFNMAEPENVMKFGIIHPGVSTYNFTAADSIAAFARSNNMALRGHTLVWHNQNPSWLTNGLTNGSYTPVQLSSILKDHIATVVGHFAGQVYAWDVVNEAFNDNGTLRSTLWYDAPGIGIAGTGYVEQAFRWAREADPKTLLFYNDYSAEGSNAKSDAIFKMAQDFKTRGVPIDGIGLQMHFTTSTPPLASMEANLKRITDLGLQVHITELDVRLPVDSTGVATSANLATQAQIYANVVALCLKFPLCTSIQTWGFTDKYSWIPGTFPGMGAGLPFDANYQAKPAHASMLSALQTSPVVVNPAGLVNAASYSGGAVAPGEIFVLFSPTFGPSSIALDSSGHGSGAILDASYQLVSATNPARRGDVILLYATGGGVTAPSSIDGQIAVSAPYPVVSAPVSVKIGGTDCGVRYIVHTCN